MDETNAVAQAIHKLGGTTAAVVKTGASAATWARWRRRGWIDDARVLLEVARMTDTDPNELAKPTRRSA